MYEELAAVKEIVDLSPEEALNSAQTFLTQQGYRIVQRTDTLLTADRRKGQGMFGHSLLNLTVAAQPQPQGGVRIQVRGNDREGVQAQQAEWKRWADGLPKKRQERTSADQPERTVSLADEIRQRIEELQAELERTLQEESLGERPNRERPEEPRVQIEVPEGAQERQVTEPGRQEGPTPTSPSSSEMRVPSNVLEMGSYIKKKEVSKGESPEEVVSSKVVEAESFRLVNGEGEIRAVLTVDQDSPYLGLWDRRGRMRAMMSANEESVTLGLTDRSGHLRLRLAIGSDDSPALDFVDANGELRFRMTMEDGEFPSLTFVDRSGNPRATLKEDQEGRHLLGFVDASQRTRATFHVDPEGIPKLVLRDISGAIRYLLTLKADGTPNIGLFDRGEEIRAALLLGEDGLPTLALSDSSGTPRALSWQ